ncbi:MAG: hypothetical protein AB7S38_37725 [Vulcanimicrobiota bacterium]
MCIFTGEVEAVSNTSIFARVNPAKEQYLAYEMAATLPEEMAMVLPLPTAGPRDVAVTFIDLSGCPDLFTWLREAFEPASLGFDLDEASGSLSLDLLPVVDVGSFEASYVPQLKDFERLDPRFRLDATVWAQLPDYADYGFAVFKLKAGNLEVHPMGLKFTTRFPDHAFFPTVHVHHRTVPERETFDHELYLQSEGEAGNEGWSGFLESPGPLGQIVPEGHDTGGMINPSRFGFRRVMKGIFPNQDVLVPISPVPDFIARS